MKKALVMPLVLLLATGLFAQDGTMMKSDKPAPDGSMMKAEPMMDKSVYDVKGLGRQIQAFTTEKDAMMLAKTQTVVYFFAATWCPTCQETYRDLKANFAQVPKDVTILFVNYDKSAELKKKYGVTMQHSFVVVGPGGEKRKIWNGSMTAADLVKSAKMM